MARDQALYDQAKQLRLQGMTYQEIGGKLDVAKSTLSLWLRDLPFPEASQPNARRRYFLENVQRRGAAANREKRLAMWRRYAEEAKLEMGSVDRTNQQLARAILSMLYWAEGSKHDRGGLTFANTDPRLAALFLSLLRRCYRLDEQRLRVRLHIHHYHDPEKVEWYWSKLLSIPLNQFQKTFVKPRSATKRFRQNFMGICFVRYQDSAMRRSIMSYAYALQDHLAPVAQGIERVPAEDEATGSNPVRRTTATLRVE